MDPWLRPRRSTKLCQMHRLERKNVFRGSIMTHDSVVLGWPQAACRDGNGEDRASCADECREPILGRGLPISTGYKGKVAMRPRIAEPQCRPGFRQATCARTCPRRSDGFSWLRNGTPP